MPIPQSLAVALSVHIKLHPGDGEWVHNEWGDQLSPKTLQRHFVEARVNVAGLAPGFRYHNLRHYLASLLIASGADVKVVQARLRHASAGTTLDTYSHLWPDSDDSTRTAIEAVFAERRDIASVNSAPFRM